MLIDFLRYEAFYGRLQGFFEGGWTEYADPEHCTGRHLRYSDDFVQRFDELFFWELSRRVRRNWFHSDVARRYALRQTGLVRTSDSAIAPYLGAEGRPPAARYKDDAGNRTEILVDIDPRFWSERYLEPRSFDGTPISFRRSGPARANLRSGSRILDETSGGFATLCGVFETPGGRSFGLTCAHATRSEGDILLYRPRRFMGFPWGSSFIPIGSVAHYSLTTATFKREPVATRLDAALIHCRSPHGGEPRSASAELKPISSILQEDPVSFTGASKPNPTPAKIAALTVEKSMDLQKDGKLWWVGDVLMLGHRQPMYFVQGVSQPGDSGAAVRFAPLEKTAGELANQWYGMILGSDECGGYATHAECIWGWAENAVGEKLSFYM